MQKNKNTIVITGGHAGSTAYATIEQLKKKADLDIHFIGGKSSVEGKRAATFAKVGLAELNITIHEITSGRLRMGLNIWTFFTFVKLPLGILSAAKILLKIKPFVIVSFGGYAAYPVVVAAWFLKIPIILHEQTSVAGRANILSAFFARKIALARESSLIFFPKKKCVVIGNPIPSNVHISKFTKFSSPAHIFITGGISGSIAINSAVYNSLDELTSSFQIIHQTGEIDYSRFKKYKDDKGLDDKKYMVYKTIRPSDWGNILKWADILVGRSGANFVYQLLIIKKPAVLVPIPVTYKDEQRKNALYAKNFGVGTILEQKDLNSVTLIQAISDIYKQWPKKAEAVSTKTSPDIGASERLADIILTYKTN